MRADNTRTDRHATRHAIRRIVGTTAAAVAAIALVFGVFVMPDPSVTSPSAVKKLYDPKDL